MVPKGHFPEGLDEVLKVAKATLLKGCSRVG